MLSRMPQRLRGPEGQPGRRRRCGCRSFIVRRACTDKQVAGQGLPALIAELAEAALPLLRFGWDAVDEVAFARA